ncbi:hypothetical protein BJ165DRAFT_731970 [Panaeolus papilionaceus]|nr:hypothetical protein BJ165DRAFT_731970 [Panaeolus papilionaceus]
MTGFTIINRRNTLFLPQELSESILQCIRNDLPCLRQCSLVCRSWKLASQRWLFQEIKLNTRNYEGLSALIQRRSQTYSFSSSCRSLHIHSIDIGMASTLLMTSLFTSVTDLHLKTTSFLDLAGLVEFISGFSDLRSLELNDISWSHTTTASLPTLPGIERLQVVGGHLDYTPFFNTTGRSKVFPNLLHLTAGPLTPKRDMPALGLTLSSYGASSKLQNLTVSFACGFESSEDIITSGLPPLIEAPPSKHPPPPGGWSPLHVKYRQTYGTDPCSILLPELRMLRVDGFLDVRYKTQSTALFWAPRLLVSMLMPTICTIELTLALDRAGQLDQYGIHWSFIDFAFSEEEFDTLERVVFVVTGSADLLGIADIICTRLPMSAERGIIYIRSGEEGSTWRASRME